MALKKTKGLGRGLDALLGGSSDIEEAVPTVAGAPSSLNVTQMQAGKYQPRTRMDEGALQELAASIRAQGLMQPIPCVRSTATDAMKSSRANAVSVPRRSQA
jgi:ParB family transcriptional regulator, chromosome partitioning protein